MKHGFPIALHRAHVGRRALSAVLAASLVAVAANGDVQPSVKPPVQHEMVVHVTKELARLTEQAEQESGPEWPRPSSGVAYLLLVGLAAEGSLMDQRREPEHEFFRLENGGGVQSRLYELAPDARVVMVDRLMQDKSGSYITKKATLYVRDDGRWTRKGHGITTASQP